MGTKRIRSLVVGSCLGLLTLAAACGGAQDKPPGPLSRHFEDTFLAQIALDQRTEELKAKSEYDVAVLEEQKAEADLASAQQKLDLAKNERDKARIDLKSAQSSQKAANNSADLNRMKDADKDEKTAESASSAADARFDYLKAYKDWLKTLVRYTQHNTYAKEANYELAQAKLAKANNIQPRGFNFDDYQKQANERAQKAQDYKAKAEDDKQDVVGARSKWLAMQKAADQLTGHKSDFEDPMANLKGEGFQMGTDVKIDDGSTQPTQDPTMHQDSGEHHDDQPNNNDEHKDDNSNQGGGDQGDGGGSSTP
jgi:hypothetical protein